MGSRFMAAPKPSAVETEQRRPETEVSSMSAPEILDSSTPVVETQVSDTPMHDPSTHSDVPPDAGQSSAPGDLTRKIVLEPPPGNWTAAVDPSATDVYSTPRTNSPLAGSANQSSEPIPGAAPKARGPPRPLPVPIMINVPLPLGQRMNPHVPPPRINVPIPKMMYTVHPQMIHGLPLHLSGIPYPQQFSHPSNVYPHILAHAHVPPQNLILRPRPARPDFKTVPVPLRGPPPTPPPPPPRNRDDTTQVPPPFNAFTPVPGVARSPEVVGVPYSGATPTFTTPRNPVPRQPMTLTMLPRRLFQDQAERPIPKTRVTGNFPRMAWRPLFEVDPQDFPSTVHPEETYISPTSPGENIPDPHVTLESILEGIAEAPFTLYVTLRPPSPPSQLSTEDEADPFTHPSLVTILVPEEGITTSSLDPCFRSVWKS